LGGRGGGRCIPGAQDRKNGELARHGEIWVRIVWVHDALWSVTLQRRSGGVSEILGGEEGDAPIPPVTDDTQELRGIPVG